jgi:hypothetical protein
MAGVNGLTALGKSTTAVVRARHISPARAAWSGAWLLGLGVAVAAPQLDQLAYRLRLASLSAELPAAAAAALSSDRPPTAIDVDRALRLLDEDPIVRTERAVYQAAMLRPDISGSLLASRSGDRNDLVQSGRLINAIFAAPEARPTLSHPLRQAARRKPGRSSRRPIGSVPAYVEAVLADAAWNVGVDLGYLRQTAGRESGFNAYAAAATSSARGLFQFIAGSWLDAVHQYGARHGLAREAALVRYDRNGRPFVADPRDRQRILALRFDPMLNARLAAESTASNRSDLRRWIGREPSRGELYAAHVLGSAGASRLIRVAYSDPGFPAARLFPQAAAANRRLFFEGGRPRPCLEVLLGFH